MVKTLKSAIAPNRIMIVCFGVLLVSALDTTPMEGQARNAAGKASLGDAQAQQKNQAAGRVVRAQLMDTTHRNANTPCPVKESFVGDITTNGPAEVKYTWVSFDGGTWPEGTLHFTGAGRQRVSENVTQGAVGKNVHGWLQLKVLSPNPVDSNRVAYTIICPGKTTGRITAAHVTTASVPERVPACPFRVNFNGAITSNGPAEVTYTWTSSDNSTFPQGTWQFPGAGTHVVQESWTLGVAGKTATGWVRLKVLSPNPVMSNAAQFRFVCPGSAQK